MREQFLEKMEPAARDYFESLPPTLRANIMQCGVTMTTKEQLEAYCKNVLGAPQE